jgi:hypothetical protein
MFSSSFLIKMSSLIAKRALFVRLKQSTDLLLLKSDAKFNDCPSLAIVDK